MGWKRPITTPNHFTHSANAQRKAPKMPLLTAKVMGIRAVAVVNAFRVRTAPKVYTIMTVLEIDGPKTYRGISVYLFCWKRRNARAAVISGCGRWKWLYGWRHYVLKYANLSRQTNVANAEPCSLANSALRTLVVGSAICHGALLLRRRRACYWFLYAVATCIQWIWIELH